ncbi:hypothetical protein SY88_21700 [Clostridiales bacterium PH28_bin88]|nr:hypothetical protein SY88_21700 [Clostridiales bacterium PH28_bin88]
MDNYLGVAGWAKGGRYGIERYLFFLHRISGLGLIVYLLMHIYVTGARIYGAEAWEASMAAVSGPLFKFGEYLVMAAFVFHALNGIRLVLIELGIGIGKPERQEYPYVSSVMKQRPLMWVLMALVAVLLVVSGLDFFVL